MPTQEELVAFHVEAPPHPELKKIAQDVLQGLKYSFLAAAAQQDQPFAFPIEEEFRKAILTRPSERRAVYRDRALTVASTPPPAREALYGRYGVLTLEEYGRLGFAGASSKLPPRSFNQSGLVAALKGVQAERKTQREATELDVKKLQLVLTPKKKPTPVLHLAPVKAIRFYITEVRCVDETNPEIGGNDEILMGGLAIDESGNTSKIGPFLVRDDFEDGNVKAYGLPGKEFCGFDATKGKDWPKTYAAVVVLAEEDWGGFVDGLANGWATAAPMIKKYVQEGIENIAEAFIGDFLAEWLGKIVAWVVDNFVGWLIDLFADDIFKPGIAIGGLHTAVGLIYRNFGGWQNFASPPGKFTFVGHGGKYTVDCQWRVEM